MNTIKKITKEEFLRYFNMLKAGNPQKAWSELAYAMYNHKDFATGNAIEGKDILKQWEKYSIICIRDRKDARFIKSMDKWIKDKDYLIDYSGKIGMSYLDRYKNLKK